MANMHRRPAQSWRVDEASAPGIEQTLMKPMKSPVCELRSDNVSCRSLPTLPLTPMS